jgi:hypothetical protein
MFNQALIMSEEQTTTDSFREELNMNDFIYFKYMPISYVDVEWELFAL